MGVPRRPFAITPPADTAPRRPRDGGGGGGNKSKGKKPPPPPDSPVQLAVRVRWAHRGKGAEEAELHPEADDVAEADEAERLAAAALDEFLDEALESWRRHAAGLRTVAAYSPSPSQRKAVALACSTSTRRRARLWGA